jgi:hypothetical protein
MRLAAGHFRHEDLKQRPRRACSSQRERWSVHCSGPVPGLCTGWRAFPMLNLPVQAPARPGPAHLLVRAAPVRREPLSRHGHHLSHRDPAGQRLPARVGTSLEAAPPSRPRGVHGRLLARRTASTAATFHKTLKIHLRLQPGPICDHRRHPTPPPLCSAEAPVVPCCPQKNGVESTAQGNETKAGETVLVTRVIGANVVFC